MKVGWFLFCAWEGQQLKCCQWLPGRQLCPSGPLWLADCKLRQYLKCNPPRIASVKAPGHSSTTVICKMSACVVHSGPCGSGDNSLSVRAVCFLPVPRMWLQILCFWLITLNIFFCQLTGLPFPPPKCKTLIFAVSSSQPTPALCILSCAALRHHPPSALSALSLHLSCSSEKPPSCFLPCHIWQEELYLKVTKTDNFSHSQSSQSTLLCQQQAGRR